MSYSYIFDGLLCQLKALKSLHLVQSRQLSIEKITVIFIIGWLFNIFIAIMLTFLKLSIKNEISLFTNSVFFYSFKKPLLLTGTVSAYLTSSISFKMSTKLSYSSLNYYMITFWIDNKLTSCLLISSIPISLANSSSSDLRSLFYKNDLIKNDYFKLIP